MAVEQFGEKKSLVGLFFALSVRGRLSGGVVLGE